MILYLKRLRSHVISKPWEGPRSKHTAQSTYVSTTMAPNRMSSTAGGRRKARRFLCVDITGIDLSKSDTDPAMLSLVERLATALRALHKGKAKATDGMPQADSSDPRKLIYIDVTDVDFTDPAKELVDILFSRLWNALASMAEKEAKASNDSTQSPKVPAYLVAKYPSPSINTEDDDSARSSPILGPFSGPWQGPQHFLDSWQDDLDAFEDDSEIYKFDEFDEDHMNIFSLHDPASHWKTAGAKMHKVNHKFPDGTVRRVNVHGVKINDHIHLVPMQAEICHVDTDDHP